MVKHRLIVHSLVLKGTLGIDELFWAYVEEVCTAKIFTRKGIMLPEFNFCLLMSGYFILNARCIIY